MKPTQTNSTNSTDIRERAYRYHLKGLTCLEIGKLLDLSPRTIERYSQTDKWKERANPQPLAARAKTLYKQGLSYAKIAKTLRVGKSTVYNYLRTSKKEIGTMELNK